MKLSEKLQKMKPEEWTKGDYEYNGKKCVVGFLGPFEVWEALFPLMDAKTQHYTNLIHINDNAKTFQEAVSKATNYLRSLGL